MFALSYIFLFYFILLSLRCLFVFLMRNRVDVDLDGWGDGEELGGIEVGGTIIRNLHEKLFSIKKCHNNSSKEVNKKHGVCFVLVNYENKPCPDLS